MFVGPAHIVTVAMMCDWTMDVLGEGPVRGQLYGLKFRRFLRLRNGDFLSVAGPADMCWGQLEGPEAEQI